MIKQMGSLRDIVDKLPFFPGGIPEEAKQQIDDRELVRMEAIIQSMTKTEKVDPYALIREPSRVSRLPRARAHKKPGSPRWCRSTCSCAR
ncbi:MAG: hypothetical protein U0165_03060 [Polyangiaceae bacterium]